MPGLIPIGLSLLAALLVFASLKLSTRAPRPGLLRIGACVTALGITLLWLLPWWLLSTDRGAWAMPMFIGVLVVAVSVLGGGLQVMRLATGARAETVNDYLFDDFVRHKDLP